MSEHSVLIIGCGSIGERHLRCFRATQRARVTACDNNPELLRTMETRYGVPGAADWREALATGAYTAAVVCTPAPLHVPMGRAALEAGLHVLIEKPLSHSLEGIDELLHARERTQRQVAVAYVFHLFPFLAQARAFFERGELGKVLQITVQSGQPFHLLRPGYAKTYYRQHETGGGAIQDALTHFANWVESVAGPTESLLCDCAHLAIPDVTIEDTVHICARHAGGAVTNYALNQFQHPNESSVQLNCAAGSIRIELNGQRWGVFRTGAKDWEWHPAGVTDRDAHFIAQANAFLDLLEGKPSPLCSLAAAAQTLRFNLAALASARSGTRVHCQTLHG